MFILLIILLFAGLSPAQDSNIDKYQFISPLPGSKLIMPESNIIIRQGDILDPTTIKESSIEVVGLISGVHTGEFFLSDDMRTLIFIPSIHFTPGEKVNVKLYSGIYTANRDMLSPITFDFYISQTISEKLRKKVLNDVSDFPYSSASTKYDTHFLKINKDINDDLPEDFPEYYISVFNNPSDGYIFTAPYLWPELVPGYLLIMDNYGVPIFYRKFNCICFDFKLNRNGLLTYYTTGKFYELDSSYAVVDSFACGNGYSTDVHDLQILANGHSLLMSYDYQTVRMDTIVPGGDTAATVIGLIIQELDETKNVVFQWRSWDHFKITDATHDIDLTAHTIDYVHGNSVDLDIDGNLIISCRHMDEITKICKTSGEVIWRLGGENNQFQFVNDPRGFSHQHDARHISNGNLTLFDNGNLLSPKYSSSLEYQLDETDKIATLVWNYANMPHYSRALGNSTRLSNGRTFIGWGSNYNPAATEVKYDGTKTFELVFNSVHNYRAFRFPWRTNLLIADSYIIDFKYITVNTIGTKEIVVTNNSNEELLLTSYYSRSSIFSVVDDFPITLQPFQNRILQIQFSPDSIGVFSDDIHLRMQKEYEMISQVINVLGSSDPSDSLENETTIPSKFSLTQNFPNPFNSGTTIRYSIPTQSQVRLRVYNSIGENIADLINANQNAGNYEINWDAGNVASGIYLYSIEAIPSDGTEIFRSVRKMILLK